VCLFEPFRILSLFAVEILLMSLVIEALIVETQSWKMVQKCTLEVLPCCMLQTVAELHFREYLEHEQ